MKRQMTNKKIRRGVTLVEILVVVAITGILILAISRAFVTGLDLERAQTVQRTDRALTEAMEQRLTILLRGAILNTLADDTTTFFLGTSEGSDTDLGSDRLTFTTTAPPIPLSVQQSPDDFETQQKAFGPTGGVAEVSLGLTPVGNVGDRTGLFLRVQRPTDSDTTQGGRESVLDARIIRIGFEFYNGTEWATTWDTQTGEKRLPAAVRVNYILEDDAPETIHRLLIAVPTSDVTANNPTQNGATL